MIAVRWIFATFWALGSAQTTPFRTAFWKMVHYPSQRCIIRLGGALSVSEVHYPSQGCIIRLRGALSVSSLELKSYL